MNFRRILSLATALVAAFALAIPAGAQTDEAPEQGDREPGNPVAHCLPAQAGDDGDDEQDGSEEESDQSEEGAPESQTVTPAQQNDQDARQDGEQADDDARQDGEQAQDDDVREDGEQADGADAEEPETDTVTVPQPDDRGARGEVAQCVLDSLPDIVGNPHAASVVAVVGNRIAQGKADGTYGPQDPVTRAQMATFLSRALDLSPSESAELPDDVDAANPHADAVAAVIEEGIALGKADGSFGPHEAVNRGQMASFLDRALDLAAQAGTDIPADAKGNVHENAIQAVTGNGIAQGFTDGTFRPADDVTRGQMATFLTRALDL